MPGIGKTLEEKLKALDETGDIPSAVKLRAKFPAGLVEITQLPGFGAKRARQLYDALGDRLARGAARGGRARARSASVKGFGPKAEENLLEALAAHEEAAAPAPRILLSRALPVARADRRPRCASTRRPTASRSPARCAGMGDTAKDIDIIATASDPAALIAPLARARARRVGRSRAARPARAWSPTRA